MQTQKVQEEERTTWNSAERLNSLKENGLETEKFKEKSVASWMKAIERNETFRIS